MTHIYSIGANYVPLPGVEIAADVNFFRLEDALSSGGTAAGVATQRGEAGRYLQAGQEVTASIDGIGTLRMPVVGEDEPHGLTGAQLPPVNTYRRPRGGS